MVSKTLYDKLWDAHLVEQRDDGLVLTYVGRHILHGVTSPQAFEGLCLAGRKSWRTDANIVTPDHNVSTTRAERKGGIVVIADGVLRLQAQTLDEDCDDFGITEFRANDVRQDIVHVVGPEQDVILPGMAVVCGDSHTSTHGAFGALTRGTSTSEVEYVLATQHLVAKKVKNMLVKVEGRLPVGIMAKSIALAAIGRIGAADGNGHAIKLAGSAVRDLSIEGRMTIYDMSIEADTCISLVAVDRKTVDYVKGRPLAPSAKQWNQVIVCQQGLVLDTDTRLDTVVELDAAQIKSQVNWGTSPEMVPAVDQNVPDPARENDPIKCGSIERTLKYMGLQPNQAITDIQLDRVFIGFYTNSRIEDLRTAAEVTRGHKVAMTIKQALVVPGPGLVREQAEKGDPDRTFIEAGFEWCEPDCSMCLAMNSDWLESGEHCASTSNRNFGSRQDAGGRTRLVSPAIIAAAAADDRSIDVRELLA